LGNFTEFFDSIAFDILNYVPILVKMKEKKRKIMKVLNIWVQREITVGPV